MSHKLKYASQILIWIYIIICVTYVAYLVDFILAGSGSKCDPDRPAIEASVILLVMSVMITPALFFDWRGLKQKKSHYPGWYRDTLKVRLIACVIILLFGLIFGSVYIAKESC